MLENLKYTQGLITKEVYENKLPYLYGITGIMIVVYIVWGSIWQGNEASE